MHLAPIGIDLLLLVTLLTLSVAAANVPDPEIKGGFPPYTTSNSCGQSEKSAAFEHQHADNPIGPVAEAVDLLFGDFQPLGMLQSQFYESDSALAAREKLSADPAIRARCYEIADDSQLSRGFVPLVLGRSDECSAVKRLRVENRFSNNTGPVKPFVLHLRTPLSEERRFALVGAFASCFPTIGSLVISFRSEVSIRPMRLFDLQTAI